MIVPLDTWSQHVGLLISYYITFSFWSAQTLALSLISRNIAGQTKKSVAIAVNFIIWSTGNAVGKIHSHPPNGENEKEQKSSSPVSHLISIPWHTLHKVIH